MKEAINKIVDGKPVALLALLIIASLLIACSNPKGFRTGAERTNQWLIHEVSTARSYLNGCLRRYEEQEFENSVNFIYMHPKNELDTSYYFLSRGLSRKEKDVFFERVGLIDECLNLYQKHIKTPRLASMAFSLHSNLRKNAAELLTGNTNIGQYNRRSEYLWKDHETKFSTTIANMSEGLQQQHIKTLQEQKDAEEKRKFREELLDGLSEHSETICRKQGNEYVCTTKPTSGKIVAPWAW